ncbi:hypothetical protein NFI96_010159 [Prochilodus magdalenae]|nr:hypothetical protein NFI96_010159 [Prochilodus magdalenae]
MDAFVDLYGRQKESVFSSSWPSIVTVFSLAALGAVGFTIGATHPEQKPISSCCLQPGVGCFISVSGADRRGKKRVLHGLYVGMKGLLGTGKHFYGSPEGREENRVHRVSSIHDRGAPDICDQHGETRRDPSGTIWKRLLADLMMQLVEE